jgi:hypothetical protein
MNPWLMEELRETRVSDLHRTARQLHTENPERLLAKSVPGSKPKRQAMRRIVGSVLVRAGSRVGGFEVPGFQGS